MNKLWRDTFKDSHNIFFSVETHSSWQGFFFQEGIKTLGGQG
jgi:hypothetical protein